MKIKSDKAGIARTTDENKALTKVRSSKGTASSQNNLSSKYAQIKEGQQLRGQILDLRYNEAQIRLEPDKQVVTAKLSGNVSLSIGEDAKFIVTENDSRQLELKYIPDPTTASASAIYRALAASNLSPNERNKEIVTELLNQRMPVDKQTLGLILKAAVLNPEASILSLVLIHKNNIPLTAANIRQFEAYQKGTGQLVKELQTITQSIPDLVKATDPASLSGQQWKTLIQNNDILLSMLSDTPENSVHTSAAAQEQPAELVQQKAASPAMNNSIPGTEIPSKPLPSDAIYGLIQQYTSGRITASDALQIILRSYPGLIEWDGNSAAISNNSLFPSSEDISQFLQTIIQQAPSDNSNSELLSSVLDENSRARLALLISSHMPDASDVSGQIKEGNASLQEAASFFREILSTAEPLSVHTILQAPEYQEFLEHAFHQKWTISPEKLAAVNSLTEFYDRLKDHMEKLSTLEKPEGEEHKLLRLQEPAKNVRENLQFMKDLNEAFTCMQLPVHLKNQDVHSELYIYTNKNKLQEGKQLSVLLHLEMTNLGSMNIQIRMDHNLIHANFNPEDITTGELIKEQLPVLEKALKEKGYHLTSEVQNAYQKPDFSHDFIEQASKEGSPMRYTFDIRT